MTGEPKTLQIIVMVDADGEHCWEHCGFLSRPPAKPAYWRLLVGARRRCLLFNRRLAQRDGAALRGPECLSLSE